MQIKKNHDSNHIKIKKSNVFTIKISLYLNSKLKNIKKQIKESFAEIH